MSRLLTRLSTLLFGLFVVAGLAFGASTVSAVSTLEECGDDPWEVGTCPPYSEEDCDDICDFRFGNPGDCINQGGEVCCVCLT